MTIANYFVAEMKANPEKQKILVSFRRVPTSKEKKAYESRQKERKSANVQVMQHMAQIFTDHYGEPDPNYDLAFSTLYMILKVKDVQKKKLTIGTIVSFSVPESYTDILKPVKPNE